jgi:hypothetical protein
MDYVHPYLWLIF